MTFGPRDIDQAPNQHFLVRRTAGRSMPDMLDGLAGSGLQNVSMPFALNSPRTQGGDASLVAAGDAASVATHMAHARTAIIRLMRSNDIAVRDRSHAAALRWLAENRHRYKGQWVAMQGAKLVASGPSGREVYAVALKERPPALVTKIEADDLPFGGW